MKPIEILLVEDNPGDVKLTKKAFEKSRLKNEIHVATDGLEAMKTLRQEGEYADVPKPDIVLLDLNLPRMNGDEVLVEIKDDPDLKRIPVVILTSSEAEADIAKTYDEHANAYLKKPVEFQGFVETVQRIEGFWFTIVQFPSGNEEQ